MRPFCPKLKAKRDSKQNKDKDASSSVMENSATDKTSKPSKTDHDSATVHPLADWKYIEQKDNTKEYPDSKSKAWKWCSQCKCRATGCQGIMQLSHFDKDHVDGFRQSKPTGMLASVMDPDQGVPLAPPMFTTVEPDNEDEDPDGLVFTVADIWHCEVSYGSDPVTPIIPSTGPVPVDDTVVAPDELLNLGMWCAPTVLVPPSVTLTSRESFIERGSALQCSIDVKDKLEENQVKYTQHKVCETFTTHSTPSTNVSRYEATWLTMLLVIGAVCAYRWKCLKTLKNTSVMVVWNILKYQLFNWSTLYWDTLAVFTAKPKKE
jgi:hypothetical protein